MRHKASVLPFHSVPKHPSALMVVQKGGTKAIAWGRLQIYNVGQLSRAQ
jgi:hypothetical protein